MLMMAPATSGQMANANGGGGPQQHELRLQPFIIMDDPNYTPLEVCRGLMPAGWVKEGGVEWDLRDDRPAQLHVHIFNPNGVAAYDIYPNQFFHWDHQAEGQNIAPDYRYMGLLVHSPPADQFEALEQYVIPRYRPDLAQARIVGKTKLKDAATVAYEIMPKLNPNGIYWAAVGCETFEYELNGKTVQEEFFVTYEKELNQRLGYMGWQILNVNSTRGLKGRLGELNILRAIMTRSFRFDLPWYTKITQFVVMRHNMILQQLKNRERQREALQQAREEANDAERKEFEQHWAAEDRQADAYGDYERDVTPWKTQGGGTVKLPNSYGRAWQGGDGSIIMSNDGNYDPNQDPNTHTRWTSLQQGGN
jgi:hypothetical protein